MTDTTKAGQVLTREIVTRFWRCVDTGLPDECWEWQAGSYKRGYGQFYLNGRSHGAHRVSWFIANREWPGDRWVLHRCDNPPCVNPRHLFLGDHAANMRDMAQKDRNAEGERHPFSKVTEDDVVEIRQRYAAGETQLAIAEDYAIEGEEVSNIVRGIQWADSPGPTFRGSEVDCSWLREARIGAGVNQYELSAASGVSQSHISYIERGVRTASPRTAALLRRRLAEIRRELE